MKFMSIILLLLSINISAEDYLCTTRISTPGQLSYMNKVFSFDEERKVMTTIFQDYIIERKLAFEDSYGAWMDIKIIKNQDVLYDSRGFLGEPTHYLDWSNEFSYLHTCQKCNPNFPRMCPDEWKSSK